jgi:acyl carrier protein
MMEEKLLESMADILETDADALTLDTEFRADDFDWDSLKGYAILVMIEDDFGKSISVDDFVAAKTLRDLLSRIDNGK